LSPQPAPPVRVRAPSGRPRARARPHFLALASGKQPGDAAPGRRNDAWTPGQAALGTFGRLQRISVRLGSARGTLGALRGDYRPAATGPAAPGPAAPFLGSLEPDREPLLPTSTPTSQRSGRVSRLARVSHWRLPALAPLGS